MSKTYSILFLGDIVGRPGRRAVINALPDLMGEHDPLFVIANAENAAAGSGLTPGIADDLFKSGVDVITLGDHAFRNREVMKCIDDLPICRPANYPPGAPGRGKRTVSRGGVSLDVINLCGRTFMEGWDNPFRLFDEMAPECGSHLLVDFHAEATSEKAAFGFHVEGRATAVLGTHTHVQTSDECVLPGGTAFLTDAGMCGPWPSVIGRDRKAVLRRFTTNLPTRFDVADEPGVICGALVTVERESGRAAGIERIRLRE